MKNEEHEFPIFFLPKSWVNPFAKIYSGDVFKIDIYIPCKDLICISIISPNIISRLILTQRIMRSDEFSIFLKANHGLKLSPVQKSNMTTV